MKPRRPLDTVAHRNDRLRYFSTHPLCERCAAQGKTTMAYILHHRDHNQLNRLESNFEALCNDCHEIHHERKTITGCDVNGMPIDARHEWNK